MDNSQNNFPENIQLFSRIKTVTQSMVDGVRDKIEPSNPAFHIYSCLNTVLQDTPSLEQFFEDNVEIKNLVDELLSIVEHDEEYKLKEDIDKKKRGWNVLGDELTVRLSPRFCKQKPFDRNRDASIQVKEWMESNSNLDIDTDTNTVCAGFLAIHFVK